MIENLNNNKSHYHIRFGEKANNCEGPHCEMYKKHLNNKYNQFKNNKTAINMVRLQKEIIQNKTEHF